MAYISITSILGGLVVLGIFVAIVLILMINTNKNTEQAKASVSQEALEKISSTPCRAYLEEPNHGLVLSVITGIKVTGKKAKVNLMYYNFPYQEYVRQSASIALEVLQERQFRVGDMVEAIVKIDDNNVTTIKGIQ